MEKTTDPVGAHLVGSVPLADAEEVFRRSAKVLGARLRRIPTARPASAPDWIAWQYPHFRCLPQFEARRGDSATYGTLPQLRLRPGERVRRPAPSGTSATPTPRSRRTPPSRA